MSILADNKQNLPIKPEIESATTIGIDLGLKHFIIDSNGNKTDNPKYYRDEEKRLKQLQRKASKKQKGSKNRIKANLKVAKCHEKIKNRRKDFLHKLSSKIISENQTIIIESLNVKGMIKNRKLSKSISDASWSQFTTMLQYKSEWYGKNLIKIDRFEPSTKTCSNCGAINNNLTLKDREWTCSNCNAIHDRDINAAINIKKIGIKSGMKCPVVSVEKKKAYSSNRVKKSALMKQKVILPVVSK